MPVRKTRIAKRRWTDERRKPKRKKSDNKGQKRVTVRTHNHAIPRIVRTWTPMDTCHDLSASTENDSAEKKREREGKTFQARKVLGGIRLAENIAMGEERICAKHLLHTNSC